MTSPNTAPVFGRRSAPIKLVGFTLISYRGTEEIEHEFTARAAIDASTALQANNPNPQVAAKAIQNLLLRVLVDDDGIPQDARPRQLGAADSDEDNDEDDSAGEVAVYGTYDEDPSGLWVIGDDESKTFPSQSLASDHGREHGSSLRRFAALMDDPRHWVELSALKGLVKYLNKESAATGSRPTKPSSASSRSRTAKRQR